MLAGDVKADVPRSEGEHGTKQTGADQPGRSEGHCTLSYEDIFSA